MQKIPTDKTRKSYIDELSAYRDIFETRKNALRGDARDKVAEILSHLPKQELVSDNAIGWLKYENMSDEWVEAGIHGMHLDENGDITVTCDFDYDDDGNACVKDWYKSDREMTFSEYDHYSDVNWPLTLLDVISELKEHPEKLKDIPNPPCEPEPEQEPARYAIDFGGNVMAKIEIENGEPKVLEAMEGYGNAIDKDEIRIHKLTN